MLLAWNTLQESVVYLSRKTHRKWTKRQVIQACLDSGIIPHMQLSTNRDDVPDWMKENEMVELPFNIDLLSFLGGDGLIQIVRYRDVIYKFKPGIKAEPKHLRLSKVALCKLLTNIESKCPELKATKSQDAQANTEQCSKQSEQEICDLFDPIKRAGIAKFFHSLTEEDWRKYLNRASRNGLADARQGDKKPYLYNPAKVADWLVSQGLYSREHVERILANNLPERSKDDKSLITGEFD